MTRWPARVALALILALCIGTFRQPAPALRMLARERCDTSVPDSSEACQAPETPQFDIAENHPGDDGGPTAVAYLPASPRFLWQTDHERSGLRDWSDNDCGGIFDNGSAYTEYSRPTGNRTGEMRLRVPNMNTGNSEGARAFRWCESRQHRALFYSAWYYIPQTVRVSWWWSLMEWKSRGSFNAKFRIAVGNRRDGQMYLFLGRGADSGGGKWDQSIKNLPAREWVHLEAYYEKAIDQTGRVTLWQDGVQIVDVNQVSTANSSDLGWAIVNYGQYTSPSDVEIFVDNAAISTERLGP